MKKVLAALLCALLLISAAMAEEAMMVEYTEAEQGFSLRCPDSWIAVDDDFRQRLVDMLNQTEIEGFDEETTQRTVEAVQSSGMFMLFAPDLVSNMNVTGQVLGMEMAAQDIVDTYFPAFDSQYSTMFGNLQALEDDATVAEYGENEFAHLAKEYELGGSKKILHQYFLSAGEKLYIITFTMQEGFDPALLDHRDVILESFQAMDTASNE